jgi:hypothetical protein
MIYWYLYGQHLLTNYRINAQRIAEDTHKIMQASARVQTLTAAA